MPELNAPSARLRPELTIAKRRTPKRSELIAQDLANYIIDEDLKEGTPLPPEHEMIASLGVGRTTLREALRLLETRGVLSIKSGPGGGPIVQRPKPQGLSEALTLILQFEGAALQDVVEARRWLEAAVSRLAATRITAAEIAELRAINAIIAEHPDDQDITLDQNALFHKSIGDACGNTVLRVFLETIISIADGRAVGVSYGRKQIEAIVDAHEKIIQALESHDPDEAGAAMNEHLEASQAYWRRRYGAAIKQPVRWMML
jgi:DNA-binding FadR family transcriptional regulator